MNSPCKCVSRGNRAALWGDSLEARPSIEMCVQHSNGIKCPHRFKPTALLSPFTGDLFLNKKKDFWRFEYKVCDVGTNATRTPSAILNSNIWASSRPFRAFRFFLDYNNLDQIGSLPTGLSLWWNDFTEIRFRIVEKQMVDAHFDTKSSKSWIRKG